METKIKHLEMIQATIVRMATCSFMIKGWSVTLVAALLGFCIQVANPKPALAALLPVLLFWWLDGYYLRQERMYRNLFDHVRLSDGSSTDFSMNASKHQNKACCPTCTMFSQTIFGFHFANLLIVIGAIWYLLTK